MKLPSFEYATPATLTEAISLLASRDGDAKVIAGGQSLIPLLAFRIASPALLIDLRRLPGLDAIAVSEQGVRLGAKVRWCNIERDPRLADAHPLLVAAIAHVAHYQVRNRGTVGGSLAHADPASEMPGIAVTCDAEIAVAGSSGQRVIPASEFFVGPLTTTLAHDELIVEVRLPAWPAGRRWAFQEFARRRGDFAIVGIALFYDEVEGRARNAHIGVIGASDRPHRIAVAEAALNGRVVNEQTIVSVARAAKWAFTPLEDLQADADYRRALVETLVERALTSASA
jgi:aerobic carbon-monoxide dehydrogenase medium subunit